MSFYLDGSNTRRRCVLQLEMIHRPIFFVGCSRCADITFDAGVTFSSKFCLLEVVHPTAHTLVPISRLCWNTNHYRRPCAPVSRTSLAHQFEYPSSLLSLGPRHFGLKVLRTSHWCYWANIPTVVLGLLFPTLWLELVERSIS